MQVGQRHQRSTVRRKPGTAFEERNLAPTFVGQPITIQFFAGFSSQGHTPLVAVRQRTEKERESPKDRLGLNSTQYVNEILIPYILPMHKAMGGAKEDVHTIEDGASYHTSAYTRGFRLMNGILRLDWAAHSPDMNPIENVWSMWKARFRRVMRDPNKRPHGREEIIKVAQQLWEELPWKSIYKWIDRMPERVTHLYRRNGGPTPW